MKRIFIPTSSGSDWQKLLAKPDLHWKSGRSAMSAAACWEDSFPNLPEDILNVLDSSEDDALVNLELVLAVPEWETDLPGGDRPSQTDILAVTRNESGLVILGVEAKVDEPFGPTVGEKRRGASAGQQERLTYLQEQLGCSNPVPDNIRYQLLHRTVSAALTAQEFHAPVAVMLVQSFSPVEKWRDDFDAFCIAVEAQRITPNLYEIHMGNGARLLIGWCHGSEKYLSSVLPSAL
ncbi:MAG: hypothetical protein V7696_17385 [Halioglobus sp.]